MAPTWLPAIPNLDPDGNCQDQQSRTDPPTESSSYARRTKKTYRRRRPFDTMRDLYGWRVFATPTPNPKPVNP